MTQESLFLCLMVKTVFLKYNRSIPEEFQPIIDNLEKCIPAENNKFTKEIKEAVEILMDYEDSSPCKIEENWDFFHDEIRSLGEDFSCVKFLNVSIRYVAKAMDDCVIDNRIDSLFRVYDGIKSLLKKCKRYNVFNENSWVDLQTIAKDIVAREAENRRRRIEQAVESVKYLHEFALRIMNFIFILNFKTIPPLLKNMLDSFPEENDNRFQPRVQAAIVALLNDENLVSKKIEQEYPDDTEISETSLRAEIRFLTDAVCYTKTALSDFCEDSDSETPWRVFIYLVEELTYIKENVHHYYILWNQMIRASACIISTYKQRNPEIQYQVIPRSESAAMLNNPSEDESHHSKCKCCPCKCS